MPPGKPPLLWRPDGPSLPAHPSPSSDDCSPPAGGPILAATPREAGGDTPSGARPPARPRPRVRPAPFPAYPHGVGKENRPAGAPPAPPLAAPGPGGGGARHARRLPVQRLTGLVPEGPAPGGGEGGVAEWLEEAGGVLTFGADAERLFFI